MAVLVESPWPWLLMGIVVEAVLAILLAQTGRGKFLAAMIAAAVVVGIGLLVERAVVTDREAVADTLDAAVKAVRANDIDRVLGFTAPTAQQVRVDVRWVLDRFEIRAAGMHSLEITLNRLASPPTARAKFLAVGNAADRRGQIPYQGFSQHVVVELRRYSDRWLVTKCDIEDLNRVR